MTEESELTGFIAKFAPDMRRQIRGCQAKLQDRFPDAVQPVYDNYNFFVIGFGPTRRPSDAILSLAAHRGGVNLCFRQRGPELPDPTSILRGSGKVVRTVSLSSPEDLDRPDVRALIDAALGLAKTRMDSSSGSELTSSRCQPSSDRANERDVRWHHLGIGRGGAYSGNVLEPTSSSGVHGRQTPALPS